MSTNNTFPKSHTYEFMKTLLKEFLKPPEKLTVSQWADLNRFLPQGVTSEPGRWRTNRTPYLKDILNCISSKGTMYIVIMSCNQVGKGEVINNAIGYFIHQDPSPMLMVQPTVEAAEGYSQTKLNPMFEACRVLKERMKGLQQKVRKKIFPGGFLLIVGANSPTGLASNTVKSAFLDEVDRYPDGAGKEGDQIELAIKRTDNFAQSRKIVITSTPGEEERSKVNDWYKRSTQEVWCVPCPSCRDYTHPTIEDFDYKALMVACKKCGSLHTEFDWKAMQKDGKYIAKNPGNNKIRGFHLNAFSSPWLSWETIGMEYEQALKDPLKMTVFMNTRMGLPWKGVMALDNAYKDIYEKNRSDYKATLHKDILLLTAGIDVQKGWWALEVVGWGADEKSYGVEYKVFRGNPDNPEDWKQVDEYLEKKFYYKGESYLKIKMTFIDTGGHYTQSTYDYLYGKEPRGIYGIKGDNTGRKGYIIRTSIVNKPKGQPVTLVGVGVNDLKALTFERLEKAKGEFGYCYFPSNPSKGYDKEYFKGLYSEKKVKTVNKYGYQQIHWEKIRKRNEPLDVRNYATAAMKQLSPNFDDLLKDRGEKKKKKITIFKRS